MAEGGTLLRCYVGYPASRVRIPGSPNFSPPCFERWIFSLDFTPSLWGFHANTLNIETSSRDFLCGIFVVFNQKSLFEKSKCRLNIIAVVQSFAIN